FGNLEVSSPRWVHCACRPYETRTFSPLADLLTEHCSPRACKIGRQNRDPAQIKPHGTTRIRYGHVEGQTFDREFIRKTQAISRHYHQIRYTRRQFPRRCLSRRFCHLAQLMIRPSSFTSI